MDKTAKKYKIIRYCANAAFLLLEATVFLLSGKFTSKETGEVVFWGLPAYASVPLMIGIFALFYLFLKTMSKRTHELLYVKCLPRAYYDLTHEKEKKIKLFKGKSSMGTDARALYYMGKRSEAEKLFKEYYKKGTSAEFQIPVISYLARIAFEENNKDDVLGYIKLYEKKLPGVNDSAMKENCKIYSDMFSFMEKYFEKDFEAAEKCILNAVEKTYYPINSVFFKLYYAYALEKENKTGELFDVLNDIVKNAGDTFAAKKAENMLLKLS